MTARSATAGSKLRVVVTGLIAQYPLGGVTWDYLQYVLGMARLGHDVYYIEDSGQWPYNPLEQGTGKTCDYNVDHLRNVMARYGLGDRWAYRFPWGPRWYGMDEARRADVLATADLLINVSGTLADPGDYDGVARLAYIDSDPVFTQAKLARGQRDFAELVSAHDVHFSFGEALSDRVPQTEFEWLPTRQPIVLSEWATVETASGPWTTVMNWTSYNTVTYQGQTYGQKDVEFRRFLGLPAKVEPTLEVAMNPGKNARAPRELLEHKGWKVVDPQVVCPDFDSYRTYIRSSRAEWSVAKNGYVVGKPGWFSCRSACYLAAGRPVVVQDTGIADILPVGEGISTFNTTEEAADRIEAVEADIDLHARAARDIAHEYFDSDKILTRLIERAVSDMRNSSRPIHTGAVPR